MRRGSLNEITILEHEQFIGEERAAGHEAGLRFGGVSSGRLLDDDSGDSSDYFCGVSSSLCPYCPAAAAAAAAATAVPAAVSTAVILGLCSEI